MLSNISRILTTLLFVIFIFPQSAGEKVKDTALEHMEMGRYGEAIDLLNKYIASNPRNPEGYNLRGLSYEKRQQYENAASDLRIARKLAPKNIEYRRNYARILEAWHKILYRTIEGRKREIAINPGAAENYLEIGKAYRGLENWAEAEKWYDEYLVRDPNASPDEIIRYTNILMMTKNLKKGEEILKKYVEDYPDDWRLWSRYGYYTLWRNKYKIAEEAFENALSFKPFFKEAMDGLDQARREGYIQPYVGGIKKGKVFIIDKYYRTLAKNPGDTKTRFLLIDQLIKYKRIEEAYTQLKILQPDFEDDENFKIKWDYVTEYREEQYDRGIEENFARLRKNPKDKQALMKLIEIFSYREEYEDGLDAIESYYEVVEDDDPELLFTYARFLAWSGYNELALEKVNILLKDEPENKKYRYFKAQLLVWLNKDIETAEIYMEEYLKENPEDISALISYCTVKINLYKFDEAEELMQKIEELHGDEYEIENLESKLAIAKLRLEEERIFGILEQGRILMLDGKCEEAIPYYIDYIKIEGADSSLKSEFADIYYCAGYYNEALEIYDTLLSNGYTYSVAMQRAKIYYEVGDSTQAVRAFKDIADREPGDFYSHLYLGDSYSKVRDFDSAGVVYDSMLTRQMDSTQIETVLLHKSYLPKGGLFTSVFYYANLVPSFLFYTDNVDFKLFKLGARFEGGINEEFSFGATLSQARLSSAYNSQNFSTIQGNLYYRPHKRVSFGVGYGPVLSDKKSYTAQFDFFAAYQLEERLKLMASYQQSNSAQMMYSGNLLDNDFAAGMIKTEFEYHHKSDIVASGYYKYVFLDDSLKNNGNDVLIRVGKKFNRDEYRLGYEFYYSNYKINTFEVYGRQLYYSPKNFESHCIWGEWTFEKSEDYYFKIDGRAGYVPDKEYIIREVGLESRYLILDNLDFAGELTFGSTYRDQSSYSFVSGILSLYWNL